MGAQEEGSEPQKKEEAFLQGSEEGVTGEKCCPRRDRRESDENQQEATGGTQEAAKGDAKAPGHEEKEEKPEKEGRRRGEHEQELIKEIACKEKTLIHAVEESISFEGEKKHRYSLPPSNQVRSSRALLAGRRPNSSARFKPSLGAASMASFPSLSMTIRSASARVR